MTAKSERKPPRIGKRVMEAALVIAWVDGWLPEDLRDGGQAADRFAQYVTEAKAALSDIDGEVAQDAS